MMEIEQPESPMSSDSAHTPLQDEHIACDIATTGDTPVNIEIGETVDMAEEQLDYEEFIENNEESKVSSEVEEDKAPSEAEEGEYDSADDVLICEAEEKQSLENGEINSDEDTKIIKKVASGNATVDDPIVINEDVKCDGELAEGELKAEEEDVPYEETPWERGLRLARERRELAKMKKVQEKDKLKERQLHINLDHVEEVEPISKPLTEQSQEIQQKFLKAMQPIVILPEEPRQNEMILEYYLAESDYQHRPRFIPSRLYTLDPWEVEEWKRELDMMKMESEIGRLASNKHKRMLGMKPGQRLGRRGSVSSSGSSRSSSISGNKAPFNQSNRTYEFHTSQYALSRNKPSVTKNDKLAPNESAGKSQMHRGQRDLPPEFKNRVLSSSRSSSRSSSGSSSSGSSSSSRSTSSPRISPKKRPNLVAPPLKTVQPAFRTIKKPALGRARSDSSGSSKSSDSSSSSSDSSSSRSSGSSGGSRKARKSKTDKQFINSWFTKAPQNPLAATVVADTNLASCAPIAIDKDVAGMNGSSEESHVVHTVANNECELPSAGSRPGVKLKLVSRPKPVIMPGSKPDLTKDKTNKKNALPKPSVEKPISSVAPSAPSNIFNNNKSIFSSSSGARATTGSGNDNIAQSTKESALKSNLAATQLEMQQEFLRNYKDKIAIYRSQLSYQQTNPLAAGQHPGTLTHTQPPPIKGPITVMSVTSKKTGPPKTQVKVTDRYSQHEEHARRHNRDHHGNHSHYSPNYRSDYRVGGAGGGGDSANQNKNNSNYGNNRSRNRSRSYENNNEGGGGQDWGDKHGRPTSNYFDNNGNSGGGGKGNYRGGRGDYDSTSKFRDGNNRPFNSDGPANKFRDRDQHDRDRTRFQDGSDRSNRFDRSAGWEDRPRRDDRFSRGGGRDGREGRDTRDFNRNRDSDQFGREERPGRVGVGVGGGDRFRDRDERDNADSAATDKRSDPVIPSKQRPDLFDTANKGSSRPRIGERDSTTNDAPANADETSKPAPFAVATVVSAPATLPPVTAVPKEKRREELLKQLKAVEDAIAKKKAKIDK